MLVLGIDPGPTESAYVIYNSTTRHIDEHAKARNDHVVDYCGAQFDIDALVIEQIAAMGMAVGAEVFETCFWSGRFAQAWDGDWHRVKRHEVKMHVCGNMRAKDGNIRQALIDRWGGKENAIGRKAKPGPLYGVHGDEWSALAVAVTWSDTHV